MAKRDNPRYQSEKTRSGKNTRAAHAAARGSAPRMERTSRREQSGSAKQGRASQDRSYRQDRSAQDRPYRQERPSQGRASQRPARGASSQGTRYSRAYGDSKAPAAYRDGARTARAAENIPASENPNLLIGRNPVFEAIKSGRTIDRILMQKDGEGSIKKIAAMAREEGIQLQYVDKIVLDKLAPGRPHQGVAAFAAAHAYAELEDILEAAEDRDEAPLIVLLDGLEDPHNLGAILRSADGAGAHGVVIPSRRSVSLTETVAKASAGAIEYVPVAKVGNLGAAIDELKEQGIWIAAVDMDGEPYSQADLSGPLAIVIGGEGKGVSRLVKDKCDFCVSIPMKGRVNSLNASNAAAVILYEAERQRSLPGAAERGRRDIVDEDDFSGYLDDLKSSESEDAETEV